MLAMSIWGSILGGCSEKQEEIRPAYKIYTKGDTVFHMIGDSTIFIASTSGDNFHLLYDSSLRDSTIKTKDRHTLLFSLLGLAIIAATVLIILTIRKNRKIDNLASNINSLNEQSRKVSELVSGLMKEKVSIIRTLSDGKRDFNKDERHLSNLDQMENLKKRVESYEGQISEIKNRQNIYDGLESSLNEIHEGVMTKLRKSLEGSLKEEDFNIIACILSRMNASSISFLTGISAPTLRTRKSRYKSRISSLPDSSWKEKVLDLFSQT